MKRTGSRCGGYIGQAWLVLAMALLFGAVLAGAHIALQPRIDENKLDETYGQVPHLVRVAIGETGRFLSADRSRTETWETPGGKIAYKAFAADGRHLGWVIKAVGDGFADKIELLIGLDKRAEIITGLYVLAQKETPGLGNKIAGRKWKGKVWADQFTGRRTDVPLEETKAVPTKANQIEAITGATISSNSVCGIVNNAVGEFRDKMGTLKKKD